MHPKERLYPTNHIPFDKNTFECQFFYFGCVFLMLNLSVRKNLKSGVILICHIVLILTVFLFFFSVFLSDPSDFGF